MVVNSDISLVVFAVVGLVIPFVVDLVTKQLASQALKQTVLLALSLISGVLIEFINTTSQGGVFDWHVAAIGALTTFVTGVATIKGLDGTPILGRTSVLSTPTSNFGIGKQQAVVPAPAVVANPSEGVVDPNPGA